MYHTAQGDRTLQGAERRLFSQSLGMIVDMLRDGDVVVEVPLFDDLDRGVKIGLLHQVARALLMEQEPAPKLTAPIEATVASIYQFVRCMIELEVSYLDEDALEEFDEEPTSRELVVAACRETGYVEEMPCIDDPNLDEWDLLVLHLESQVLWDNDWESTFLMDAAPESGRVLKDRMGISDGYFTAIPDDPDDAQVARLLAELIKLTPEGRGL